MNGWMMLQVMILLRKISRFQALHAAERQVFLSAMVLLPAVSLRMKFFSIKSTLTWLSRQIPLRANGILEGERDLAQARRTAGLVRQAIYNSPIKGECLSQSLVLWHLLSCQGIESEVRIGVQKEEERLPLVAENFNAHAWVEYQGEVLNDQPDVGQRYIAFKQALAPPEQK